MTQREQVYQHLIKFGCITSRDALKLYSCLNLKPIISTLINDGIKIKKEYLRITLDNGLQTKVLKYTLVQPDKKKVNSINTLCAPCKFCGNMDIHEIITKSGSFMICEKCNVSSDIGTTTKESAMYWNLIMEDNDNE